MRPFIFVPVTLVLAIGVTQAQDNNPTSSSTPPAAPMIAPQFSNSSDPSDSASTEPEISLEALVRRAQAFSPRLKIARANLEAAQGNRSATRALPGATLQLVPGFSGTREARDEDIILAQPLDVFGLRRARTLVSAALVRRAEAENRLAARIVEVEVRNAAAQLFAAQETEKLERAQVEIAQQFREAAAKRAAVGDVPGVQVQRADLELLRAQNDFNSATAQRLSSRAVLNGLIGAAPDAPLRVASGLEPTAIPTVDAESKAADLSARPDIASAQANLEARQADVKAIRRERLPQVELQARHAPFVGRDGGSTALRAVITVPLFDWGTLKGRQRAAQAEADAQAATVQLLSQQAITQVATARAQLQSLRETVSRYQRQIVPLTLDLLRKTQIGYAQGASSYLEVLEAQRTLRQVQSEYLKALVGVQNAEIALDAAQRGGTLNLETALENSQLRGETR